MQRALGNIFNAVSFAILQGICFLIILAAIIALFRGVNFNIVAHLFLIEVLVVWFVYAFFNKSTVLKLRRDYPKIYKEYWEPSWSPFNWGDDLLKVRRIVKEAARRSEYNQDFKRLCAKGCIIVNWQMCNIALIIFVALGWFINHKWFST